MSMLFATAIFAVFLVNLPAFAAEPAVEIEPLPPAPPTENQYIGFKLMAPWMDGYVRVRFPENINSGLGLHFLDNLQPELKRVSRVEAPKWERDEETGAISYSVKTDEGVWFGGEAVVEGRTVAMTYWVENHTGQPESFNSQVCIDMEPSPTFNERVTLEETHTWFNGEYQSLAAATAPKSKLEETGFNWVLMLVKDTPDESMRAIEATHPWWIVEEMADYPLIARETPDGERLLGVAFYDGAGRLMTNTNIPCLHADPQSVEHLENGQRAVWRGRLFVMENEPGELLRTFLEKRP